MSKENWQNTGKELGSAFEGLAKTFVRSALRGADKLEDWAEGSAKEEAENSSVFSDGSWKKAGKDLGSAIKGLGKTLVETGDECVEKAEEWAEGTEQKTDGEQPPGSGSEQPSNNDSEQPLS